MAPRRRGGSSISSRWSHETEKIREQWETQKRVNGLLCIDLQATQKNMLAIVTCIYVSQMENAMMKDRITAFEEYVRLLFGVLPQPQPHPHTSGRVLLGRDSSSRRCSDARSSRGDPFVAGTSSQRHSGKVIRYSPEYVPASQDMSHDDDESLSH